MNKRVFLNRRSGRDRRQLYNSAYDSRRRSDRRLGANNELGRIIGNDGLDRFELIVIVSVILLMPTVMLAAYFSSV